jgi:hypothetical protein
VLPGDGLVRRARQVQEGVLVDGAQPGVLGHGLERAGEPEDEAVLVQGAAHLHADTALVLVGERSRAFPRVSARRGAHRGTSVRSTSAAPRAEGVVAS